MMFEFCRSAERYRAIRQTLGEPDPFRLRYRNVLRAMVRAAVQERVPPGDLPARICKFLTTEAIPHAEQARFQATAIQELRNLKDGTFARYGLKPSAFETWKPFQEDLNGGGF